MANIKIDALPAIPSAALTDVLPTDQTGVTYKVTLNQIYTLFGFGAGGILQMTNGGTGANLNPLLGAVPFSTATTLALTAPLTNGQILIGSTGLAPAVNTITGSANVSITNGPGTITIAVVGLGSFQWNVITATSATMISNNGYITNNAGLVTLTLPLISAVGDEIDIIGKGAGGWLVAQNAGQSIVLGNTTTSIGIAGSLSSSNAKDSFYMICTVASTEWTVASGPQGNLTVI